jgi:hypothetical protein
MRRRRFATTVEERQWAGRQGRHTYLTTADPDLLPLGEELCTRCWWRWRMAEISSAPLDQTPIQHATALVLGALAARPRRRRPVAA